MIHMIDTYVCKQSHKAGAPMCVHTHQCRKRYASWRREEQAEIHGDASLVFLTTSIVECCLCAGT